MGNTDSLLTSCARGETLSAMALIALGAGVNRGNDEGITPLHTASQAGQMEMVKLLLSKGADVNSLDQLVRTPLIMASGEGRSDIVRYLIEKGASVNFVDATETTPLHYASRGGHTDTVKPLIENGADVNLTNEFGCNPLHVACIQGHLDIVQVLIEKGSSINRVNLDGTSPLHCASIAGQTDIVEFLLRTGADIHSTDTFGRTPLIAASIKGLLNVVRILMTFESDINFSDRNGFTALHQASKNGHLAVAELFCDSGAVTNRKNRRGQTPLHLACFKRHVDVADVLVHNGADVNAEDLEGHTPLFQRLDIARHLAYQSSYIPDMGHQSTEAFHAAAETNEVEVVRYLLARRFKINKQTSSGQTALHVAISKGSNVVGDFLLEAGADCDLSDSGGKSPLLLALNLGHYDIVVALLQKVKIDSECPLCNTETVLRAWAGNVGYVGIITETMPGGMSHDMSPPAIRNSLPVDMTEGCVSLLIDIYVADFPLEIHNRDVNHIKIPPSDKASSILNVYKRSFPSLQSFARAVIRATCRNNGISLLYFLAQLPNDVMTRQTKLYVGLCDNIMSSIPEIRDSLNSFFARKGLGKIKVPKREATIDQLLAFQSCNASTLKKALTARDPRLDWILGDIVHQCPDPRVHRQGTELDETPSNLGLQLKSLNTFIHIKSCRKNPERPCLTHEVHVIHKATEKILSDFLSLMSGHNGAYWSLCPTGSFYMNNKVGSFNELDYLAKRDSTGMALYPQDDQRCCIRHLMTIPLKHQHGMACCPKQYLSGALNFHLRDMFRPPNPGEGKVYVRSCYPHPRGPGVCVQLAWVCIRGHTHELGVDLSPAVEWKEKFIRDIWTLPECFDKPPFSAIKESILNLPVLLVQDTSFLVTSANQRLSVMMCVSFTHSKKIIFECLGSVSTNIETCFHLLKYFRDFLPLKLKYSAETVNLQGSWKSSPVISSHVLYNTLLQEVEQHPSQDDWADHLLPQRLSSLLIALRGLTFIDFFKGIREHTLTTNTLSKQQEQSLRGCVVNDIDNIRQVISQTDTRDIDNKQTYFSNAIHYRTHDQICMMKLLQAGEVLYSIHGEGRLRYDTTELRKEMCAGDSGDLYYYQIPPPPTQCMENKILLGLLGVILKNYHMSSLHEAARWGNSEIVKVLSSRCPAINSLNKDGNTALGEASYNGHLDVVEYLHTNGADVNVRDCRGYTGTPLFLASKKGHLEIVEYLCSKGADINIPDKEGNTPLAIALINGHGEVVRFLVDRGAELDFSVLISSSSTEVRRSAQMVDVQNLIKHRFKVNTTGRDGCSLLHYAAQRCNLQMVELLLNNGADIALMDNKGRTPLGTAAAGGQVDIVEYLIDQGADVNFPGSRGFPALHRAAQLGTLEVIQLLCNRGADVRLTDKLGRSPLGAAAQRDKMDIIRFLIDLDADVNHPGIGGCPPIHRAAQFGMLEVVRLLWNKGANLNLLNSRGSSPFLMASMNGHLEVVQFLCSKGADINKPNRKGQTPVGKAASNGHMDVVQWLTAKEADLKSANFLGLTPLHLAAKEGHLEVVKFLCSKIEFIKTLDHRGYTPLSLATYNSHTQVVRFLSERETQVKVFPTVGDKTTTKEQLYAVSDQFQTVADKTATKEKGKEVFNVNILNSERFSELNHAAKKGDARKVERLSKGADLEGNDGMRSLHLAAKYGHLKVVKLLLDNGAALQSVNKHGCSALGEAAARGEIDVVRHLIDRGADVNLPGSNGVPPLHRAAFYGRLPVVQLLCNRGADVNLADINVRTPIQAATNGGKDQVVKFLKGVQTSYLT